MPYNQISRYANFMAWLGWFLFEYVSSNFKLHLYVTDAYFLSPTIAKCRVISILGGSDWAEVSRVSHCGHYPRQMRHIDDSDSANYQQLFSFLIKHSISFLYFFTQYPNSRIFIYFDQHLKEALLRPQMLESFIK